MVSIKFRRSKSFRELVSQTIIELKKHHSRLEITAHELQRRDKKLFDICKLSLRKGQKKRAIIYANEIAEVRKTLHAITSIKLVLERIILRLETVKDVCSALDEIRGLFSNVKSVLKNLADSFPMASLEINALNDVVNEILIATQPGSFQTVEPFVVEDESMKAIIQEAAGIVEKELLRRIPEPPATVPIKATKPMIALTTSGLETYEKETENSSPGNYENLQPLIAEKLDSLLEELVLDYIYRNGGEVDVAKCAEELGISQNDVLNILDVLHDKGKIRIER